MALRLRSLKTRTALALSSVIVAILVFNGVYMILTKREELRKGIEEDALAFARLTRAPISAAFLSFYQTDFYKFREVVRELLAMDRDVEKVLIVNDRGQVLFDSAELQEVSRPPAPLTPRVLQDPERLAAAARREDTVIHGRDADGAETLEVFTPYPNEGGPPLSLAYQISFRRLNSDIQHLVWATGGLTLISIGISLIVAVALATRITKPLSELTAGAREIAQGHFDRRLDIRSNDELQVLAESFNDMTERLKHNVEQLEESNKKLASVNEELKELDRMKSDLLANVSHELRTPLTAIKGYTDYILERKLGTISDKQEKGLVVVQRNLDRLSKSINALLDFSRMDVGRIVLNIQPFPFAPLVDQIHTTVRSELEKKGLRLQTQVDPALPSVIADREKLSAVLENLVINAIKFTPEGGRITVSAQRAAGGGKPGAEITVADTGIGIPPDQLARIFNRFHQVDTSSTRRFGGVGLGLAIVKSIVEAHESTIEVESQENKGTVFRFRLPVVERPETVAPAPRVEERAEEGLVLVVDDDPEVVRSIRSYLEEEGLVVLSASTGAEGASLAADRHPDIILLDLLLPDQSGLELLQVLKRDPATARIPVLVISIMNDAVKGLTMGAADYLVKPVDRAAVVSSVSRLLDGQAAREPTVLVVDDEQDTAELIRDTLRAEGLRTQVAHHGRQALELIARKRPDLVILDIMMPEMSGFEVLEALARDQTTAAIPVLVLTARGDDNDARRGLALGAKRYMSKPFDLGALIAEVRRHLGTQAPESRRASL
jgi:signal transduction histidine kinase/DNA-binding response OmpR family regulator